MLLVLLLYWTAIIPIGDATYEHSNEIDVRKLFGGLFFLKANFFGTV